MKKIILLSISLWVLITTDAQTFTIRQSVTGNHLSYMRGQSFIPQNQGGGTGEVGVDNTVYLEHFSFVFSNSQFPEKLYLYSELPLSTEELDNGTGGVLIAESISRNDDDFLYTRYFFDYPGLEKDQTYYVLFREDATIESGGGNNYEGGSAALNQTDIIELNTFLDLRFEAQFSLPKNNEANIVSLTTSSQVGETIIDEDAATVTISMPAYESISSLRLNIKVSENATYSPTRNFWDFTSGPVVIRVSSESGAIVTDWSVIVDKPLNTDAGIGDFFISEAIENPEVDEINHVVGIIVEDDADLSVLVPYVYNLPAGATISPAVQVPTDFTSGSVVYTVTAEDGDTKIAWTVNVIKESQATSLNNLQTLSIKYYHSFVEDAVVIEQSSNSALELTILNLNGIIVYTQTIEGSPSKVLINHLPSGIYLVKLSCGLQNHIFRIIKK